MKQSAGILVFRHESGSVEVLLVHPAGPIWGHKDFWSIPKGELDNDEDHLAAAEREFLEEVGLEVPKGVLIDLGSAKATNKTNFIWAVEGEIDVTRFQCNDFTMEWPPKSGQMQQFPENDKAAWFRLEAAKTKLFQNQTVFIDRLADHLGAVIPQQQELL